VIGDQDQASRHYVHVAIFLLGAVFAMLVFASKAADQAGDRRRDDRRRHSEDLALAEARADRHERDIRALGERLELVESITKVLPPLELRSPPEPEQSAGDA